MPHLLQLMLQLAPSDPLVFGDQDQHDIVRLWSISVGSLCCASYPVRQIILICFATEA